MSGYHRGRGRGGNRSHVHNSHRPQSQSSNPQQHHVAEPVYRPCRNFMNKGQCNTQGCKFAHLVQRHGSIDASSRKQQHQSSYNDNNDRNSYSSSHTHAISSIAVWETPTGIKLFSGSHDGFWRLWNTANASFNKEFEHNMGGGQVGCIQISNNILFCGFEGQSVKLPGINVGMIHAWNLTAPSTPPLEFHLDKDGYIPYAGPKAITCILPVETSAAAATGTPNNVTKDMVIISGGREGIIQFWRQTPEHPTHFTTFQTLCGHAGEITGLVIVGQSMLWSTSTDKSIRLWDMASGQCKYLITSDTPGVSGMTGVVNKVGHTEAVTDIISLESNPVFVEALGAAFVLTSSLDGTVKAWNGTNGECVMSESHGQGVVCMALSFDINGTPILLCGLEGGNIMIRNVLQTPETPAFRLLMTLSAKYAFGHEHGPVKTIRAGPASTFYSGGNDGKLNVWQVTGKMV